MVNNRMYGDYYKLFKIMKTFATDLKEPTILESLPTQKHTVYRDLQPYREYDFEELMEVHKQIVTLLVNFHGYLINRDHSLENYQTKGSIGLNIDLPREQYTNPYLDEVITFEYFFSFPPVC